MLRIAAAQRIELEPARERAVSDALFSAFAKERYLGTGRIESVERSVLGRSMLEELWTRGSSQGEPTDEEVAELSAERWVEFDRPVCVRTTHAVVRLAKPGAETQSACRCRTDCGSRARRERAGRIQEASARGARDGLEVVAEGLQPTSVEGRVHNQDPAQRVRLNTTRRSPAPPTPSPSPAHKARSRESKFGFHVILLEQRFPEQRVSLAERRRMMADEIVIRRAQRAERELVDRLRRSNRVEIERAAEDLTANVRIKP